MSLVNAIRIPATKPAKAAVIFIHGLGDSGDGWSWFPQLVKQSKIIQNHESINYVFPNAPQMPISVNGGYVMSSWFDIFEFGNPRAKQDIPGFLKSCETVKQLIKEQIDAGIPAEKIVLGGFSQGAALSYASLALLDQKVGGVVVLSGFCPIPDTIKEKRNPEGTNKNTPVFQGHGTADPVIDLEFGVLARDFYKGLGFKNVQYKQYEGMAHSACEEELEDVMKFINEIVKD